MLLIINSYFCIWFSSLTWGKTLKAHFSSANRAQHRVPSFAWHSGGAGHWGILLAPHLLKHALPAPPTENNGPCRLLRASENLALKHAGTLHHYFRIGTSKSLTWHRLCISFQKTCIFTEQACISSPPVSTNPVSTNHWQLSYTSTQARWPPEKSTNLAHLWSYGPVPFLQYRKQLLSKSSQVTSTPTTHFSSEDTD